MDNFMDGPLEEAFDPGIRVNGSWEVSVSEVLIRRVETHKERKRKGEERSGSMLKAQ